MGFSFFALGVAVAIAGLGLIVENNLRKISLSRRAHPRTPH
ncbi:hypothetical protein [Paraburkholderia sp.]